MQFEITHQGRTYKLYQRSEEADSAYYVRIQKDGKVHQRSCESHIKSVATTNAKAIINSVKSEKWEAVQRVLDGEAKVLDAQPAPAAPAAVTIGKVLEIYEAHGPGKQRTRDNNIRCLYNFLRIALGETDAPDQLTCAVLDDALVRKFCREFIKDIEDEKLVTRKRTCNSTANQARSIFAKQNVPLYRDHRLILPDLQKFLDEPVFRGVNKTEYFAPADSLVQKTFAALLDLKSTDQNVYLAVCLACGAGLRRSEISKIRRNSFVQRNGRTFIADTIMTKNNTPLDVPILEDWYQRILAVVPDPSSEYLLTGSDTERTQGTFIRAGKWMRELGWKTQKAIHEFRAYVGSKVCDKHGIQVASQFLRHADIATTQRKYMRYVTMQNVDVTFGPATV